MAINKRDYHYIVVKGDSLRQIAEKHGLSGELGRELIWDYEKNSSLYNEAKVFDEINGGYRLNQRQIYLDSEYIDYNHAEHTNKGIVLLYEREKIWIPQEEQQDNAEENAERELIRRKISNDELLNGISIKPNSDYELIFPTFRLRTDEDPEDVSLRNTKFIFSELIRILKMKLKFHFILKQKVSAVKWKIYLQMQMLMIL